jgi:hypothetical protein
MPNMQRDIIVDILDIKAGEELALTIICGNKLNAKQTYKNKLKL